MPSRISNLQSKISNLPQSPGVYQFLDETGEVIYIGKAKNLRSRVRQYFGGQDERPQIPFLMKEAADLDYTIVNTELESLYLERTLIQKYHPKYNIELKDDKAYAFIVIDYSTEIPQVIIRRKILEAKSYKLKANSYFGPYTSAKKIRDLIFAARRTFGLCSATKVDQPCFYYHLHRCPGVCVGAISLDDYRVHLDKIKLLLSGKIAPTLKNIKSDMAAAARQKKFEKAAQLRDQLKALEMLAAKQNVILVKPVDWDIIGLAADEGTTCVNLFKIRSGRLIDKENFVYQAARKEDGLVGKPHKTVLWGSPIIQTFLESYYAETSNAPREIFLPVEAENAALIKNLIQDRFQKSLKISAPQRGKASYLVHLSQTNAQEYLKNYLNEKADHLDKVQRGLGQLKAILQLPSIPKRIEGFDISNLQGTNPVGSMVVFVDGLPAKSQYRKFKIRLKDTPDDFAMMREILQRRLQHSLASKFQAPNNKNQINSKSQIQNFTPWPLPDLIVIDGGRGQLNAALEILNAKRCPLNACFVIGLAKRIEEIFLPQQKQPILLPHDNPALQLLQRLRDEAHRFSITFHRQLRSKEAVKSALDEIPGVGPKTKKLLKQKFGTVANIRKTSTDELTKVLGGKLARMIKQNL